MEPVDNNQFEVKPSIKSKRKIATPCPNVYLNPALDLLANEDPICNTVMEIAPKKKRKRTKSLDIAAFENSALDLGISRTAINEFLIRELDNVKKNLKLQNYTAPSQPNIKVMHVPSSSHISDISINLDDTEVEPKTEIVYPKITECEDITNIPNVNVDITMAENVPMEEESINCNVESGRNIVLEANISNYIDDITTDETNIPQVLTEPYIDMTDVTTQNGMEVSNMEELDSGISIEQKPTISALNAELSDISAINKTGQGNVNNVLINNNSHLSLSFIDRLALDSPNISNRSLCLDDDLNESNIMEIKTITIITKKKIITHKKKSTNPFLDPNLNVDVDTTENPFTTVLDTNVPKPELEYGEEALNRPNTTQIAQVNPLMPRRLFTNDTNSTMSTVNESSLNNEQPEYENIDSLRSESPIYENVYEDTTDAYNKQSRVLGHDVSRFNAVDIMNINKNQANSSNESNDSKKDLKHQLLKAGNKLSKKVYKTLKKTFKSDKHDSNTTLNPYEVPRKPPKQKAPSKESGIENPALNLDYSDEIDIEEIDGDDDEEHQYETIKTLRNTRLNMNVTPLRERFDNSDVSQNKTHTPGKKVRFDSTLNKEKVITGNSFDYDVQSPGFDVKIDKYHDELENCINERKYLEQNM